MSDMPPPPPPQPTGPSLPPTQPVRPQPYMPPPPAAPGFGGPIPAGPLPAAPGFGGPQYPYASGIGGPAGPPKRSGKALAGFILGLLSIILFFTIVIPVLAIIFGLLGAKQIKQAAGALTGKGLARAGWILGILGLIGGIVFWVAVGTEVAGTTSVFDLDVGDCVEMPDTDEEEVFRLETFDCTEAHGAEVFAAGDLEGGDEPYPGVTVVNDMISRECLPAFEDYVGVAYADSALEAIPIYPSEDNWEDDQGYVCLAYDPAGELTESIKDSGR